ncbi:unnamed protein product [Periconia digitata]|uniref:Secreted protein n=1 Tax=Periconia digitata TaxID=1303443 RepID=A0A9W4XT24_9PLEO|nr:unnamed protein product [Periconia digitata]
MSFSCCSRLSCFCQWLRLLLSHVLSLAPERRTGFIFQIAELLLRSYSSLKKGVYLVQIVWRCAVVSGSFRLRHIEHHLVSVLWLEALHEPSPSGVHGDLPFIDACI